MKLKYKIKLKLENDYRQKRKINCANFFFLWEESTYNISLTVIVREHRFECVILKC